MPIVNLSAYRFVSLDALSVLRERMLERCLALALKGTILLAPEGINLFLAGPRDAVDAFMAWLREDARFAGLRPKESLSETVPFARMRVRLKREIITLRQPTLRPEGGRAPAVAAATLRRWLDHGCDDEGRELVLLDTRNRYETEVGGFEQAVDYRLARFTDFPQAIRADHHRYAGKTVVSYCTGGIRCEKAALHMQDLGFDHVYQLEGGILGYLEETDGRHWRGSCFVFDERGTLDTTLAPTAAAPFPAGVRGRAGEENPSEQASIDVPASTHPLPQPSPRQGERAST